MRILGIALICGGTFFIAWSGGPSHAESVDRQVADVVTPISDIENASEVSQ
jgi:hypothetical protein